MITVDSIRLVSLFRGLTEEQLHKIIGIMKEETCPPGGIIIRDGDRGDSMFALLEGEVEITKRLTLISQLEEMNTKDKVLLRLNANMHAIFGEMALFERESSRSASVTATKACVLGVIYKKDFEIIIEQDPILGFYIFRNIAEMLSDRLKKANLDILKLTTAFSLALEG
jgi:CRP-like cAMP-binding protein